VVPPHPSPVHIGPYLPTHTHTLHTKFKLPHKLGVCVENRHISVSVRCVPRGVPCAGAGCRLPAATMRVCARVRVWVVGVGGCGSHPPHQHEAAGESQTLDLDPRKSKASIDSSSSSSRADPSHYHTHPRPPSLAVWPLESLIPLKEEDIPS
jgi:hypothetical protein